MSMNHIKVLIERRESEASIFWGEIDATDKLCGINAGAKHGISGGIAVIVAVPSRKNRHAKVCPSETLKGYKIYVPAKCHIVLKSLQSIGG